jgi:hypothetical protein
MRHRHRALLGAAALLGLASCATLDEEECRSADWQQIGYADGAKGRLPARFAEHETACGKHRIGADSVGWRLGYAQGLGLYCTPRNGYETGRRGEGYADVCPVEFDGRFRPAYLDGRGVAERVAELDRVELRLREIVDVLDEDDRRARRYVEAARANKEQPVPPPELLERRDRRQLQYEYDQLRREARRLWDEVRERDDRFSAGYGAPPLARGRAAD